MENGFSTKFSQSLQQHTIFSQKKKWTKFDVKHPNNSLLRLTSLFGYQYQCYMVRCVTFCHKGFVHTKLFPFFWFPFQMAFFSFISKFADQWILRNYSNELRELGNNRTENPIFFFYAIDHFSIQYT